jgi:hypothetical protein
VCGAYAHICVWFLYLGKAPAGSGDAKKPKAGAAVSTDDFKKLVAAGTVSKQTVPTLKLYLESVGEKKTGKKDELVERVNDYINALG